MKRRSDDGDTGRQITIKGPAIQLFNFTEAISISRRLPEKLFTILDLHDALSDLLPDIEIMFESKSSESIRVQATEILSRLGGTVRGILSEFENAVLRKPSRVPVPGGTIHPLTRLWLNCCSSICSAAAWRTHTTSQMLCRRSDGRVSGYPSTTARVIKGELVEVGENIFR
nr:exocyst complex component EXO70A1-like [Ipomoea batatas]